MAKMTLDKFMSLLLTSSISGREASELVWETSAEF